MKKQLNYLQLPQNPMKFPVSRAKTTKQARDFRNKDDMTLDLPAVEDASEDVSQ